MDFKEQFEGPLPIINKDTKKIYIETSNSCEGSIIIKNSGGGTIAGRIMSNSRFISFEPEEFNGNNSKIMFYINLNTYGSKYANEVKIAPNINSEEILKSTAVIMSNGGEHKIEFTIKVVPCSIETEEKISISSLKDFYGYFRKYPSKAEALFYKREFMSWLKAIGYENMDLYEKFLLDTNKERALDNFLIANKLKHRASVDFENRLISVIVPAFNDDIYTGLIKLKKTGSGYIEEEIKNISPWFSLGKKTVLSSDFDNEGTAYINYSIDPLKFSRKVNFDKVFLSDKVLEVKAVKLSFIDAQLERTYLSFKDSSNILIINNANEKLTVDITPKDSFIKLEGKRYYINETALIPFTIDIPKLLQAQLSLKKQPTLESSLYIESVYKKRQFSKLLKLTIGGF